MNYKLLANAIVERACKDYVKATRAMNKKNISPEERRAADHMRDECIDFFYSSWYAALTSVDADWLLKELDKEILK